MRNTYRIDLSGTYYLRGFLRSADSTMEGRLLDISSTGVALVFVKEFDPMLAKGAVVCLAFHQPVSGLTVEADAKVMSCASRKGLVRYGFEFTDLAELEQTIPYMLRPVFNRRRSPRVAPEGRVDVRVTCDGGQELALSLVDVSTSGMAVEAAFHLAAGLVVGSTVQVALTLPGTSEELRMGATVRDQRLSGPSVHVGLELSEDRDPAVTEAIQAFVAEREVDRGVISG